MFYLSWKLIIPSGVSKVGEHLETVWMGVFIAQNRSVRENKFYCTQLFQYLTFWKGPVQSSFVVIIAQNSSVQ